MMFVVLASLVVGGLMSLSAVFRVGTSQFPLYVIAAFVCFICAGVFMILDNQNK